MELSEELMLTWSNHHPTLLNEVAQLRHQVLNKLNWIIIGNSLVTNSLVANSLVTNLLVIDKLTGSKLTGNRKTHW